MMEKEHPSLKFHCPVTHDNYFIAFGYAENDPMIAIFKGDELVVRMPRDVLIIALSQGWSGWESGRWVDPSKN
jgi:hypothetical protein